MSDRMKLRMWSLVALGAVLLTAGVFLFLLSSRPGRDPRVAVMDARADAVLSTYTSADFSNSATSVMCPDADKLWWPSTAGMVGDIDFEYVPGDRDRSGLVHQTYSVVAGSKTIGLGSVRLEMNYDPKMDTCSAQVYASGP